MGKPNIPNFNSKNKSLRQRIEKYVMLINNAYDKITSEAINLANLCNPANDKQFRFIDYPLTKNAIKELQQNLYNEVYSIIISSTSIEWKESNLVQDLVARKVLREYVGTTKGGEEYSKYFQTNPDSLKAFQDRRIGKMGLSGNVWELTDEHIAELEECISVAIADGTPAMSLAAQVKQYLKDPNKRFRRRKEILEDGSVKWHLSNPAKAYHPEAGRYRSSARNAQRLARTEINMAYRTAEQKRWEQFDFVVGYEVKTTYSEKHVTDICDTLAGKYPKDFKFTGWHPNCMCYCIPILKTEEEFLMFDEDNPQPSVNEVRNVPQNFTKWIESNKERIEAAEKRGKLPYFIQDNKDEVMGILHPGLRKKSPWEIAEERHAARTQEDIQRIQNEWDNHILNQILNAQQSMNFGYDDNIELILNGKGIGGKSYKDKLLKYTDVLDTLGHENKIYIKDDKWKMFFTSDKIRDWLDSGSGSTSDIKHIYALVKKEVDERIGKLPFVSQQRDLHRIKTFDVSLLPKDWQHHYLEVVKGLSGKMTAGKMMLTTSDEANLASYGLNMIELCNNPIAKKFGLSKLSSRTPIQLFTVFEKAVPGYTDSLKKWRSKEFFDSMKHFVPLKTSDNGCYFNPQGKYGYVNINPNEAITNMRLKSGFFQKSILSHEYGHSMFHQYEWAKDVDIKSVYDKWVREINADGGKKTIKLIEDKLNSISPFLKQYGFDVFEQLGKLSDSAQAAIKDHPWLNPMGHKEGVDGYFKLYESQLSEIIAHSSENLWVGNPIFQKIAPDFYKEMREVMAKKLGIKL